MKIVVLSGKGGVGKTFVSVNIACSTDNCVYLDCDVEEPNGFLFLKPQNVTDENVDILLPKVDAEKCNGCRECTDFCKFNAMAYIKNTVKIFPDVCHSCGGCKIICKQGAISEITKTIGTVSMGSHNNITCVSGSLNLGEPTAVPVIETVLEKCQDDKINIIDCPPGSGCSVMECVNQADYCLIVAEPTSFGVHNFKMIFELVEILKKPYGIVINKYYDENNQMEHFYKENDLNVIHRIPYSNDLANNISNGNIPAEENKDTENEFNNILQKIISEVKQ